MNIFGMALDKYTQTTAGQIQLALLAREQVARQGGRMMRPEVGNLRFQDAEAGALQKEYEDAVATGDGAKIQAVAAKIGLSAMKTAEAPEPTDTGKTDEALNVMMEQIKAQAKINEAIMKKLDTL